jgi:enoyl-CoA hydratase/carnithine racemase
MADLVIREDIDGACFLTLNRPDVLNALSVRVFSALSKHAASLEKSRREIKCVVLRGMGRAFSAGHDLKDIKEGEESPEPHYQAKIIERLANLPQPVVASVHGYCFTGGLELALAADLIITTPTTRFADTHGMWGLSPLWGMSQRLPRRVGMSKAKEMMFTSRNYTGEQAVGMGLADLCVPDDELAAATSQLVADIVANSPHTNAVNKRLLHATGGMTLEAGLAYELDHSPGVCADAEERLARFGKK